MVFAGAGRDEKEKKRAGVLKLGGEWEVRCWSFSDHPVDWRGMEGFNYIDYGSESREMIRGQIMSEQNVGDDEKRRLGMKVVSVHWGPNYRWSPAREIVDLAHWLIDECGVDIIHGHSSHHIQGVEVYKGKLIVYGCGDFVDDYAVVKDWRNDLSAAWRVSVQEREGEGQDGEGGLEVVKLEVFPNRIKLFQAGLLNREDEDHRWVQKKFKELCTGIWDESGRRVGRRWSDDCKCEGAVMDADGRFVCSNKGAMLRYCLPPACRSR